MFRPLSFFLLVLFVCCDGWTIHNIPSENHGKAIIGICAVRPTAFPRTIQLRGHVGDDITSVENIESSTSKITLETLVNMDVVIYSFLPSEEDKNDRNSRQTTKTTLRFAAMQEDGVLSPLSAWTKEPAFGTSIELLVDEADRFVLARSMDKIQLHHLLSEQELSYGSRQCHRGVGNPHGEESELLYYVEQDVIHRFQVTVDIKPDLEILW
jgi:hypothetical protein